MAQKVNLIMDQGATFSVNFNIVDGNGNSVNLSTYTANSTIRKTYTSSNNYPFTVNVFSNGQLTLTMLAANTANIQDGRYVYDVYVTDASNNVSRLIEGIITITPGVTVQ